VFGVLAPRAAAVTRTLAELIAARRGTSVSAETAAARRAVAVAVARGVAAQLLQQSATASDASGEAWDVSAPSGPVEPPAKRRPQPTGAAMCVDAQGHTATD